VKALFRHLEMLHQHPSLLPSLALLAELDLGQRLDQYAHQHEKEIGRAHV
jgi:hypothetical protein